MHRIIDYFKEISNTASSLARRSISVLEREDIFMALIIILVAFSSFGLGRLSAVKKNREPVKITMPENTLSSAAPVKAVSLPKATAAGETNSSVLASKNGSKYYFSWCSGIDRIKKENLVSFATPQEAEQSGYTLAANCTAP